MSKLEAMRDGEGSLVFAIHLLCLARSGSKVSRENGGLSLKNGGRLASAGSCKMTRRKQATLFPIYQKVKPRFSYNMSGTQAGNDN